MPSAALNFGVNTLDPGIAADEVQFSRLFNLQPRKGRLYVANSFGEIQELGSETIQVLTSYTVPTDQYSALYAIADTSIFAYNFATNLFTTPAFYTGFTTGNLPYAVIPWYDRVYVTKKDAPMLKLQGAVATVMPNMPSARYGIVAANHLMLANVQTSSENLPTRFRWSDLYLPEAFEIATDSESDYFDLEPTDEEITGLSYQRGYVIGYSRNSIWIARYGSATFRFDPLFTGLGNVYHGGQIRVKEADFFVGHDNFYKLDGLQLSPIGDKIWTFFKATLNTLTDPQLSTICRPDRDEIEWIYPTNSGTRSLVYNYRLEEWSDKQHQNALCRFQSLSLLRGFDTIDSNSNVIDTVSDTIDGAWQFDTANVRVLEAGASGKIYNAGEVFSQYDGTDLTASAQTFEFTLGKLFETKEFTRLTLLYTGSGTPVISLQVGHRKHTFEGVTWSSASLLSNQLPGESTFHFRNSGVGRLVLFKLVITNTAANYVTELTHIEIDSVDNTPDDPEE